MKAEDINRMRGCLSGNCVEYPYFKDRYAFQVLAWALDPETTTVRELKAHPRWRGFMQRPAFQEFLRCSPKGVVDPPSLLAFRPQNARIFRFRLTLDSWGKEPGANNSYYQTSRSGWNLVLQLNFPVEHDQLFRRMCGECIYIFVSSAHPARVGKINTLAWARIDADLVNRIALIEEVQTDWLRDAATTVRHQREELKQLRGSFDQTWLETTISMLLWYSDHYLEPLSKLWDEAMLSAALWFLRDRAHLRTAYYHTWESGLWFKRMHEDDGPPRSLYTKLPRRFAFEPAERGPGFILGKCQMARKCKRRKRCRKAPRWWKMDLAHQE